MRVPSCHCLISAQRNPPLDRRPSTTANVIVPQRLGLSYIDSWKASESVTEIELDPAGISVSDRS